MSSAILYLAIVAIWAFCLVPRWVRRAHSAPAAATAESPPESGAAPAGIHAARPAAGPAPDVLAADDAAAADDTVWAPHGEPAGDDKELPGAPMPAPVSRARMLRARRRLLAGLTALTAIGAVGTTARLAAWWLFIPPAGMLGGYLLLLREAALADAEQARWRADQAALQASARERALAERAAEADLAASLPQPTAKVIDISARVGGDQFYDQYADTAARAAGD